MRASDNVIASEGLVSSELITAGTPSLVPSVGHAGLSGTGKHRVSPGTVVFHDFQYDLMNSDLNLEPAAVVLSRVISQPRAGHFTLDAGNKALAADCGHPMAFVLGRPVEINLLGFNN